MVVGMVVTVLVLASLYSPLFIVELIPFLHYPLHVNNSVIHVLVRGVMSYQHSFLEAWVKPGLKLIQPQLLISDIGRGEMREFYEFGGIC